jgi:acyl-[acyl-carrier-protein]-phospholipid O-acyltransferase/long-chain-fatty-acid--[acyl-carrier-protein] ligase
LLGVFALDLGWATYALAPASVPMGVAAALASPHGLHIAIDLAGLAISGGLFIVPSFAAVQAWAGADHRARVIAACNVLNAGFMTGGTVLVGLLQSEALLGRYALSTSTLFLLVGVTSLVAAIAIARTMPTSALRDLLSIVFRTFYRLEVKGLENIEKAGPRVIIALNHVSFLDAALSATLLGKTPVFAIDHGIAQRWWVKPFLRFAHAVPLDPLKPILVRSLVNVVRAGEPLVIFPEGRITVTGSLMKVYDGAGLIADKSEATVIPVRITGLERTPFTRLSRAQVRRLWFPKVTVTLLEPVKLTVDPTLKG